MDPASVAPRLGPIEILEGLCGDYFISGKRIVQMTKLTLDFSRAGLMLKLLYINICSYPAMFCVFYRRQATGKERRYRPSAVSVYAIATDKLKHCKLKKKTICVESTWLLRRN